MRRLSWILFAASGCGDLQSQNNDERAGLRVAPDNDGDGFDAFIDCDDDNDAINPGELEDPADGLDNDCDGAIDCDDNSADLTDSCYDGDQDGYCDDTDGNGEIDIVFLCNPEDDQNAALIAAQTGGDPELITNYIVVEYQGDPISGYTLPESDCDDTNSFVHPSADEVCNGMDDDCDGMVDDGVSTPTPFYADQDADSYGDPEVWVIECEMPLGYVMDNTDCDDDNEAINPDASEICDGLDNDCDAMVDDADDSTDSSTMVDWYLDEDEDGYGDPPPVVTACEDPTFDQLVTNGDDCDDDNEAINPDASEICDGLDNDCDGVTDPDTSSDAGTWYLDADSDSYGNAGMSTMACDQPLGHVADWTDCDDGDSAINPGASEVCDELDNDCDAMVDDADGSVDPTTGSMFYADDDNDSYGNAGMSTMACDQPPGYVMDNTDCNDGDGASYPGAPEVCDSVDNDCDGVSDDGVESTFYADNDADGKGNPSVTQSACEPPVGFVDNSDDCDDTDMTVYLGADELCDEQDNDCDVTVDEDPVDETTWYDDHDADGYGESSVSFQSCDSPPGFVETAGDCDDSDGEINPGAIEIFNEIDDDCDGLVDEGTTCLTVIEILNDAGEATQISAVASDDASLSGVWYPDGVAGVSVTPTSLGGDNWHYGMSMDLCVTVAGSVIVDAHFQDGSALCEEMAATGLIFGYMDSIELNASAYDNGDGTCSVILNR